MADEKIATLITKTLQYANTPNMDYLATGVIGMANGSRGFQPGSDVAIFPCWATIPKILYKDAPLEAVSMGIERMRMLSLQAW